VSGSLGGATIARGRVQLSKWGLHWADVSLTEPTVFAPGALVDLKIADVTLKGAIVSGGAYEGAAAYRWVGGKGKWGTTIPAKPYANDANIKAATVLSDAASACGEMISDLPTTRLGPNYARRNAPAIDVLHLLAPSNWYVDFDGVTRIGARPTTIYSGSAPRTRVDPQAQIVELAVEELAGIVPGVTVDGYGPALDVEYLLEPKRLTARIWAGRAGTTRRLGAMAKIVDALTARFRYAGVFEFRVVTQDGERLNLQPVRVSSGFGDLPRAPVRPGVAGARNTVQLGELVLVAFVDQDPSRYVVVAHDAPDAPGWVPLITEFGGPGALGVARIGDLVQAGPYTGVITSGSATVKAAI